MTRRRLGPIDGAMVRWRSGVALAFTLMVSACEAFERWQGPPLKQGSVMTFAVTEVNADQERAYPVRLAFIGTADDRVAVQVRSERVERTFKLEKDLVPAPGERLEITMSAGHSPPLTTKSPIESSSSQHSSINLSSTPAYRLETKIKSRPSAAHSRATRSVKSLPRGERCTTRAPGIFAFASSTD